MDPGGIDALLRSDGMAKGVEEVADAVASNARALGIRVEHIPGDIELPVVVSEYDRVKHAAFVTIAHASGLAVQAKDGALTKAASAAGLKVGGPRT